MNKTRIIATVLGGLALGIAGLVQASAADKTTLVVMIRGLDNPYHANYAEGAKALGAKLGLPVDVLSSEGNSQKQFADLAAEIAKTGGNMVVNVDPNEGPDVVPIAKMLEEAGVYWFNWWNKPNDVTPQGLPALGSPCRLRRGRAGLFQRHRAVQDLQDARTRARSSPSRACSPTTPPSAASRGSQKALAENPGVELLQWEAADWDTNKAYEAAKQLLAAHPDVDGVWSANDNMAVGIVAALKEAGLAGKVKTVGTDGIPDAFDAIEAGTMAATEFMDSRYQAQLGLTMALAAKDGKLDVAAIPPEHRSFLISGTHVTAENVKTFVAETLNKMPEYDLSDFWVAWVGPAT